jgi:hypothetical protein
MRKADDLATRVRNWFWYWRIRHLTGLSNEALDRKFLKNKVRLRHFEQIEHSASAPNSRALLDGKTLLVLVDEFGSPAPGRSGPYAAARSEFESKLWFFLEAHNLPVSVYTNYIQAFVEGKGWIRIGHSDLPLYKTFLGDTEPAIQRDVSVTYSAMLHKLVEIATPDSVAVLIALFREAIQGVLLEQALAIKTALRVAVLRICESFAMPVTMTRLLWQMINDRVLSNRRPTQDDWRHLTGKAKKAKRTSRDRVKDFRAWVDWYINNPGGIFEASPGTFPIVPKSPRTDWIDENRETLKRCYDRVSHLQKESSLFKHHPHPDLREWAESLLVESDELLIEVRPPQYEPTNFYDSRPAHEIHSLPRAYK